jgi:hypothetical protein
VQRYILKYDVMFDWKTLEFQEEDDTAAKLKFHAMRENAEFPSMARHFYLYGATGLLGYWHGQ